MDIPASVAALRGPAVLAGRDALTRLARPIDELHDALGVPVTARRLWLQTWAQSFPRYDPWIVVVPALDGPSSGLAGAALLARTRTAGVTTVVGMGHGHSDHMRLPARDAAAADMLVGALAAQLERLRGPWRLRVEQLPPDEPAAVRLVERLDHASLDVQHGAGTPVQHLGPTVEASQFLSKSERKDRRRLRRRLDEQGAVELTFTRDPEAITALLSELAAVRARRDHQQGRLSVVDDAGGHTFWTAIIRALAAAHQLEVATLRCDGVLISYAIMLLDGDVCRLWDGRFDSSWSRFAPGAQIDLAASERAIEQGFGQLDLMRGETNEKLRHASAVLPVAALTAWSAAAVRATDRGVAQARDRLRQRKDASPALRRLWRGVKDATVLRQVDR